MVTLNIIIACTGLALAVASAVLGLDLVGGKPVTKKERLLDKYALVVAAAGLVISGLSVWAALTPTS